MDCEAISWCALKPEAQAAWVQAVGSVIAIVIAILIPAVQHRSRLIRESSEREALCRVMAGALRQPIGAFAGRCAAILRNAPTDQFHRDLPPLEVFERPPEFDQFRAQLHLLGELGEVVNEVINDQNEAWIEIRALHARKFRMNPERLESFRAKFAKFEARARECREKLIARKKGH